jgi:hypothetical protein
VGNRKLNLAAARAPGDDDPVPASRAEPHLGKRDGRFRPGEDELAEGLGRGDHERISADDQPLRPLLGIPRAGGAAESARAELLETVKL